VSLRLVGIDLATRFTGIAWTHRHTGEAGHGARTVDVERLAHDKRIDETIAWIAAACKSKPDLVVIEAPFVGTGKGGTPILLGEAHGAVKLVLRRLGLLYHSVPPQDIKMYVTGNGGATKRQVQECVTAAYGELVHIGSEHEADAFGALALAAHVYGQPLADVIDPQRLRALKATGWPKLPVRPEVAAALAGAGKAGA
jgi:crossover junction endodeoxyribonuclease RuvC